MKRRDFLRAGAAGLGAWMLGGSAMAKEALTQPSQPTEAPGELTWTRRVPLRYEVDVAVIGGGIAGVSAACSAAASGASVLLVERFATCGGVLTTGEVGLFCGQMTSQGEVFDEIVKDLASFKAVKGRNFHNETLACVLQELVLRRKVHLLLHTQFVDARVDEGGRITECVVCGKSGPEAVRAKVFIDCTGDADVARAANFGTVKGRPEDGLQLPMSMMFFAQETPPGKSELSMPAGWLPPIESKGDLPMVTCKKDGRGNVSFKIKVPMFDSTSTAGLTAAEIQGRRRMLQVLDYYQKKENKPWTLDYCAPIIGIREGARIVGDYTLTVADLRAGREFDDAVARGTYFLDGHKPDDDKRTYILPKDQLPVPPYQIPLRSLVAKDGRNLLMAGRCFSADQLALSSARVSTTCSMMGQAVGLAAAMCAAKGCTVRQLDPAAVRKAVEERGADLKVGQPPMKGLG